MIRINGRTYKPRWGNILLAIVVVAGLVDLLFIGAPKTEDTPYGTYTCKGGIIQVCGTESAEVYKYVAP